MVALKTSLSGGARLALHVPSQRWHIFSLLLFSSKSLIKTDDAHGSGVMSHEL